MLITPLYLISMLHLFKKKKKKKAAKCQTYSSNQYKHTLKQTHLLPAEK